jgi:hypothetical protein
VKAVERLYWAIKLQARKRSMKFGTAGLLVLNLGLLAQALDPQHAGSGDETVALQVEVTKKENSWASLQTF